jgi:phosphomethylpyrimidine synthase
MKISQEVREFAGRQNQGADSFLESGQSGAEAAEASKQAALKGMAEMSAKYKDMGQKLYLPEGEA